ncbi:MAG: geranylgeranylglycerol-phosphate geranylgeranyltransferase [Bacteroidetes bacterium]|nr:geranylgeranylglycerol-phosphate geranylgeranyltransferase [Bacteroidota bacterium]
MKKLKAVFKIIRPLNILITFLSVIVAGIIAQGKNSVPQILLLCAIAESLTFSAGNIINDIFDIETDKLNRPERVLPKGELSKQTALVVYIMFVLLSGFISFYVNAVVFKIIIGTNIILFLYSFALKRTILLSNVIVASVVGSAFILGASAVDNIKAGYIPFLFALLINFGREIVKDMEDIKGDTAQGMKSFPSVFGLKSSKLVILLSSFSLIIFTFYPYVFNLYGLTYFLFILIIVDPFLIFIIYKLFKDDSVENLKKISVYLKLNMVFGLAAIYFG